MPEDAILTHAQYLSLPPHNRVIRQPDYWQIANAACHQIHALLHPRVSGVQGMGQLVACAFFPPHYSQEFGTDFQ
jgi:hypothetical protein